MLCARGISLSLWCIVVAERNARCRCAKLITFDAAGSIEISFSAIYNWCKFTAWKGILSHNSPIDERWWGALGQLLSRYVFLRGAHEQISFSHSIDPLLRCSCTNTTHSYTEDKKRRARVRDRIHKKFLFWEPKAHSPFQACCLNYSSIRRQGEQFETLKVILNHDHSSRMKGKCAILLLKMSWKFMGHQLVHFKIQFK